MTARRPRLSNRTSSLTQFTKMIQAREPEICSILQKYREKIVSMTPRFLSNQVRHWMILEVDLHRLMKTSHNWFHPCVKAQKKKRRRVTTRTNWWIKDSTWTLSSRTNTLVVQARWWRSMLKTYMLGAFKLLTGYIRQISRSHQITKSWCKKWTKTWSNIASSAWLDCTKIIDYIE